jgi:predicted TIM-barrel fold metal-dependent hydrolase
MRIDCQTHVFPRSYISILSQNPQSPKIVEDGSDWVVMIGDRPTLRMKAESFDIKRKIKTMDDAGIDLAILSTNVPGPCVLAPELALKGAQAINDDIAGVIQKYPGRFEGIAALPWQNAAEAIQEMDRARDDLGFCAIMLFSNIGGRPVDDPDFEPIYAHAESRNFPIVIHPTFPSYGAAIRDYMMIPMMGFQVDSSFALLRLILGGILERHPRLKILMPHVGGVLPYVIDRIDYQTEVMGRGRDNITQPPSRYLKRIYLDTVSPSALAIKYAYDFSGVDHLLFGTDHPWINTQLYVDLIEGLDIPEEEKSMIFAENAKKLFAIG